MESETKYFCNSLKLFNNNIALVDTSNNKTFNYSEIENEAVFLALKINLDKKGLIFLFTTNNSESIITYIASLKSGNAVLLLDEKLNDEIRNGLIENYKPDFIITLEGSFS